MQPSNIQYLGFFVTVCPGNLKKLNDSNWPKIQDKTDKKKNLLLMIC